MISDRINERSPWQDITEGNKISKITSFLSCNLAIIIISYTSYMDLFLQNNYY